ncbi:hypothetical protein OAP09_01640 [Acidimicrobiia bacterium]|nr:hypothetical protein [Acidimicrobiia bacterium]
MIRLNKKYLTLFFLLFFLILLRTDYRFIEKPLCCGDDHDYFSHAETLVIDFDLDYSNQLAGSENKRYNNLGRIAPKGFVGTGLLAAPFLFLGSIIDNLLFRFMDFDPNKIFNYKILLYSLSSIFYFFVSIFLIHKTLYKLKIESKINHILLIFLGSGLPYFAFERYSMTHVYEIFTISLLFYLSYKFYSFEEKNNKIYAFLIPAVMVLSLLVRWTNYYVLLLPIIFKLLFISKLDKSASLLKMLSTYFSLVLSLVSYLFINYSIYGFVGINPNKIYSNAGSKLNYFLDSITNLPLFLKQNTLYFSKVLFSEEFGIFWFSPIIFLGGILTILLFMNREKPLLLKILLFLTFSQVFGTVLVWTSTASSYGYRYLYSLIPISIFIYYSFKNNQGKKLSSYYLFYFSLIGLGGFIFFETSELTSLREEVNSFDVLVPYTQPEYLSGIFKSAVNYESYLKIFSTSFLGALTFKILILFIGINKFDYYLVQAGLPAENDDFQALLLQINDISIDKFIFVFLFLYYFSRKISLISGKDYQNYE